MRFRVVVLIVSTPLGIAFLNKKDIEIYMDSLPLQQVKLPWMDISIQACADSEVYVMQYLETYMGYVDGWNLSLIHI